MATEDNSNNQPETTTGNVSVAMIPNAGQSRTITPEPGQVVQLPFDMADQTVLITGDDLQVQFANGAVLVFEDFAATDSQGNTPMFVMLDGSVVPGNVLLAVLNGEPVETAAGEAGGGESGGAGEYDDDLGNILTGIDKLGTQDPDAFPVAAAAVPEEEQPPIEIIEEPQNQPPEAIDDFAETGEDNSITFGVLPNDSDPDGDPIDVVSFTTLEPNKGTLTFNEETNEFTFDPGEEFDSLAAGESEDITFTYTIEDPHGASDTATVTISIEGTSAGPVATANTASVTEDGPLTDSGNMIDDNDGFGVDSDVDGDSLTVASIDGDTSGSVAGAYGTLTWGTDGSYTYTLNNANGSVQALDDGATLTDTFTYTVTDGDLTDTALVTVTINGTNDNAEVIVAAEGADSTVFEAGLDANGSAAVTDSETDAGSFGVSATDGIDSVTVGGTTFSLAQLQGFSTASPSADIGTGEGTLVITGYNSTDGDLSATISYEYTLNAAQTHSQPGNDSVFDSVAVAVTGSGGATANANLTIDIVDDLPTATADTPATLVEDGAVDTVSGNVLANDSSGADTPAAFVGWNTGVNAAAEAELAQYGTLNLNSDGSYSFVLDNSDPDVQALDNGDTVSASLSYTMQDADGDTATAALTVTINGADDNAEVIVAAEGADSTVFEAGLDANGSAAVTDSETDAGSFGVSATDGIDSVTVGGTTFSLAQLQGFSTASPSADIGTGEGTLVITGYNSTDGDLSATISYEYTLNAAQTHSQPGNDSVFDSVAVSVTGSGGATANANLTIDIVDDLPTATADTPATLVEDGAVDTVSGNVLANDSSGADTPAAFVGWNTGVNAAAEAELAQYGTLNLNSDGSYSFVLDNSDPDVQALDNGDTVSASLSYTMQDADGDTATAALTVTINGADDNAEVIVAAEGADNTVFEAGLDANGSAAVTDSETDAGSFGVSATDGIDSVTVGGTTFSLAQLQGFSTASPSADIGTGEGTLVITGYNSTDGDLSATISYEYTLNAAQTHSQPGNDSVFDSVAVSVTGSGGATANANLTIDIVDDLPTATADTPATLVEDGAVDTVSGNVLANDSSGADTPAAFVGWNTGVNAAAEAELAQYGTLNLNSDGSYSFVLDNSDPDVQALDNGDTVSASLSYTMQDADGDTATAALTVTINGADDNAEVIVAAEGADNTVFEAGLDANGSAAVTDSETDAGSFGVSATDGIDSVTVGGTTFSLAQLQGFSTASPSADIGTGEGTLVITGYNSTDGDLSATISYEYTLNAAQTHSQPGNDSVFDSVAVSVTGSGGATANANLTIDIVDDLPTATADTPATLVEDGAVDTVSGNVLANDSSGADTPAAFVGWNTGVNAAAEAELAQYGTLNLNSDGSYSFVLDNSDPDVQALDNGDTVSASLSYTMQDADGDTATAALTVTINGADDNAEVIVAAEGADNTVFEAGLDANGSAAVTDSETDAGSFGVSATDGIDSVTVGGTTFSLAQLQGFSTASPSADIGTGEGTLVITGYNSTDGDLSATISYEYTLNAAQTHSQPGNDSVFDSVAVSVTGSGGATANANLTIDIVDDLPQVIDPDPAFLVNNIGQSVSGLPLDLDSNVEDNYGADGAGSVRFVVSNPDSGLTTNTQPIYLYASADGTELIGSTLADSDYATALAELNDTGAFAVSLNTDPAADDTYSFELLKQVDGGLGTFTTLEGDWDLQGGNTNYAYYVDQSGNDLPSILVTPTGLAGTSVNTTASEIGVSGQNSGGGGQNVGLNEGVRIDFVENITGSPSNGDYTAASADHSFTNHTLVNGAVTTFRVSPPGTSTISVKAYDDIDYGAADEENDVGDYNLDSITKVVLNDVEYTTTSGQVTFETDGTVTLTGIETHDSVLVFTDDGFTTVEYHYDSGATFALIGTGASAFDPGALVSMEFDLAVTDGDGDTVLVEDGIQIHLSPDDHVIWEGTDGDDIHSADPGQATTFLGLEGNDQLTGDIGNDILIGGEGDDVLIGGDGDDLLIAGTGIDTLTGGLGDDTFGFSAVTAQGANTITDFGTGDDELSFYDVFDGNDGTLTDAEIASFASSVTIAVTGDDVTLTTDAGSSITIEGINSGDAFNSFDGGSLHDLLTSGPAINVEFNPDTFAS